MNDFFVNLGVKIKDFFVNFWMTLVSLYAMYSDYIHSIFPDQLGDLVEHVINLAIICVIVKLVADAAFHTKSREI